MVAVFRNVFSSHSYRRASVYIMIHRTPDPNFRNRNPQHSFIYRPYYKLPHAAAFLSTLYLVYKVLCSLSLSFCCISVLGLLATGPPSVRGVFGIGMAGLGKGGPTIVYSSFARYPGTRPCICVHMRIRTTMLHVYCKLVTHALHM